MTRAAYDELAAIERRAAELKLSLGIAARPLPPHVRRVLDRAAELWGLTVIGILSSTRSGRLWEARAAVSWVLRETTSYSYARLGELLGGRDHSTIISSVERARQLREADGEFIYMSDLLLETARSARPQA